MSSSVSQFPCLSMGCSQFKITSHFLLSALNATLLNPAALKNGATSREPAYAANVLLSSREERVSSFWSSIKRAVVCVMPCLPACSLWIWDSLYHNTVNHLQNTHLGMKRIMFSLVSDCLFQQSFLRHWSRGSLQTLLFLGLSQGGWEEVLLVCTWNLFNSSLTIFCHDRIKAVTLHHQKQT